MVDLKYNPYVCKSRDPYITTKSEIQFVSFINLFTQINHPLILVDQYVILCYVVDLGAQV